MAETLQPPQQQEQQPGSERKMTPRPDYEPRHPGCRKLENRVALITGGDSGIGRATALAMAREGAAAIAFAYLNEHEDARDSVRLIEKEGAKALSIAGDVGDEAFCRRAVEETVDRFNRLDILVNNAAEQHEVDDLTKLEAAQLERTFRTNVFSYFFMTKAALPHLGEGAAIINTTSITAYQGHTTLIDYSATRGAVVSFTRR